MAKVDMTLAIVGVFNAGKKVASARPILGSMASLMATSMACQT